MVYLSVFQFVVLFLYSVCVAHGHDDSLWVKFRNNSYMFVNEQMAWMEAQSVCQSIGGFLATVSNEGESKFIRSITHVNSNNIWLGGTDLFAEGRWVWIENLKAISYSVWYTNEPGGGAGENCVFWYHGNGFFWHDAPCTNRYKFLCQRY